MPGKVRKCCKDQNRKAQCAESDSAADGDHQDRRPPQRAAEQVDGPRHVAARLPPGRLPFFRFGHGAADPEDHQGGEDADQEDGAMAEAECGQGHDGRHGQDDAHVDGRLQHRGDPQPPASGPGLAEQCRAHGPFAADPEGRQETKDEQLPPGLGKRRQAGEEGVGQDRTHQGTGAAHAVAEATEESAADGPAQQEGGLDERTAIADDRVMDIGLEQFGHERQGHGRIKVHVEAVKHPAQPGRDARAPLPGREIAEPCGFDGRSGDWAAGRSHTRIVFCGGIDHRISLGMILRKLQTPQPGLRSVDLVEDCPPAPAGLAPAERRIDHY